MLSRHDATRMGLTSSASEMFGLPVGQHLVAEAAPAFDPSFHPEGRKIPGRKESDKS